MLSLGKSTKYVSVFQVEDKGKYMLANLSTSKKNQDNTYTNMYWRAKFVGLAYEKAKELKDKDKIEIVQGIVENTYDKSKNKLWLNVTVFKFDRM